MDRRTRLSVAVVAAFSVSGLSIPAEGPAPSPKASPLLPAPPRPRPKPTLPASADFRCLALNVYFEARGEPAEGQLAVARVTLNRLANGRFADSICGVVNQRNPQGACQFGWVCRHHRRPRRDSGEWRAAKGAAWRAIWGDDDPTHGALYFNRWSVKMNVRGRHPILIGRQIFYR